MRVRKPFTDPHFVFSAKEEKIIADEKLMNDDCKLLPIHVQAAHEYHTIVAVKTSTGREFCVDLSYPQFQLGEFFNEESSIYYGPFKESNIFNAYAMHSELQSFHENKSKFFPLERIMSSECLKNKRKLYKKILDIIRIKGSNRKS